MKRIMVTACLITLIAFQGITVSSHSQQNPIQQFERSFGEAYRAKTLRTLDASHALSGTVTVVIEHSLVEGRGQFETRRFKSFAKIDEWLKKREREGGVPFRQTMPLIRCTRGRCRYDFNGGILHNQLYIKDFSYRIRSGRAYITRIHLLDGD
jgi:hypothetical protein